MSKTGEKTYRLRTKVCSLFYVPQSGKEMERNKGEGQFFVSQRGNMQRRCSLLGTAQRAKNIKLTKPQAPEKRDRGE